MEANMPEFLSSQDNAIADVEEKHMISSLGGFEMLTASVARFLPSFV